MKGVLVDSSVWIAYFRGSAEALFLDPLLESGHAVVNDLILAELVPHLLHDGKKQLAGLMRALPRTELPVDWKAVEELQMKNLRHGINRVGIPDLIVLSDAIRHSLPLGTLDKHFRLMKKHTEFELA